MEKHGLRRVKTRPMQANAKSASRPNLTDGNRLGRDIVQAHPASSAGCGAQTWLPWRSWQLQPAGHPAPAVLQLRLQTGASERSATQYPPAQSLALSQNSPIARPSIPQVGMAASRSQLRPAAQSVSVRHPAMHAPLAEQTPATQSRSEEQASPGLPLPGAHCSLTQRSGDQQSSLLSQRFGGGQSDPSHGGPTGRHCPSMHVSLSPQAMPAHSMRHPPGVQV